MFTAEYKCIGHNSRYEIRMIDETPDRSRKSGATPLARDPIQRTGDQAWRLFHGYDFQMIPV